MTRRRNSDDYWDALKSPKSITFPKEYAGGEHLDILCTQTSLGAAEQRRLVEQWCEALPSMRAVTHVWFQSKVPQNLFDAACRMPRLSGLWIKWSGIEGVDSATNATNLKSLYLGLSARLNSIAPLTKMSQLRHLVLESPSRISDLKPLGRMTQLSELSAIGSFAGKPWKVNSLDPLGELTSLEYLNIGKLQPRHTSLRPLAKLTKLRFLGMDNHFPMEEYAWLSKRLSKTECIRFAPYDASAGKSWKVECRTCGRFDNVVLVTGKRGRWLCLVCDRDKVATVEAAFERAGNAL